MKLTFAAFALPIALVCAPAFPSAARVTAQQVERAGADRLVISWRDPAPVDVYAADRPDAPVARAHLLRRGVTDGRLEAAAVPATRSYFLLRDTRDGSIVRVGERVLSLQQGSNFRDLGGYPAAGGKHVRWGLIYRSGATPLLTETDLATIRAIDLKNMIDLRSSEERSLAPSRIEDVRYQAVSYPMARLNAASSAPLGDERMHAIYRQFPATLAPQLRILFRTLIAHEGPLAYNCSAGQDRTGFATAMVLSALGTPRSVILADYHLSTTYRRPEYEMPKLDPALAGANPAAAFFVKYQQSPGGMTPKPLLDSQHRAFLESSFDEIESRWGSVDAYLHRELGLTAADIAKLRADYLE